MHVMDIACRGTKMSLHVSGVQLSCMPIKRFCIHIKATFIRIKTVLLLVVAIQAKHPLTQNTLICGTSGAYNILGRFNCMTESTAA